MPIEDQLQTSIAKATRAAGGQAAMARVIGVRPSTVSTWLRRGNELPAEYVIAVEKALGIPRYELRPDIYPPEEQVPASPELAQRPAAQPLASAAGSPPSAAGVDGPDTAPDLPCADPLEGMSA
jgi:DNA-binding transcriptional regulator YdaS (Cro superfamily)